MEFRKSKKEDVHRIMDIIKEAKKYLEENDINQWQDGYPSEDTILDDIKKNESYIAVENDVVIGTVAISFRGEKTYGEIFEGSWLSNEDYVVIHRIAVARELKGRGTASNIIKEVEKIALRNNRYSIKVDTHEENKVMQNLLRKNNFKYCGIIYLMDKSKRVAFEKIIK